MELVLQGQSIGHQNGDSAPKWLTPPGGLPSNQRRGCLLAYMLSPGSTKNTVRNCIVIQLTQPSEPRPAVT